MRPPRAATSRSAGRRLHLRERAAAHRRLRAGEWLRFELSLEQNQPVRWAAQVGLSSPVRSSRRRCRQVSEPLRELQHGRCFYCERNLTGRRGRSLSSRGRAARAT